MSKRYLSVQLASPRGFCAGVDRAIAIVEKSLEKFGKPVYVRHEIVHNRFVVEDLQNTPNVDKVSFVVAPMREDGCC